MSLSQWVAQRKRAIFEDLQAGLPPAHGAFDSALLSAARARGAPQMGTTKFEPHNVTFEFIYTGSDHNTTLVNVTLPTPERVVFLSVPEWVVESIWQGDVDGSYHFESDARRLLEAFATSLEPEANASLFAPQRAKRRE